MSQHPSSASNPAGDHPLWALGYLSDAAELVETATETATETHCVRDGGERISFKAGTAPLRHSTLAAPSDDGGQSERREGVSELSPIKIHELDRVAQKLENAAYAVYEDVFGFGRIDLESVSQSDSTYRLFESVTEAHASAKIWSDADLTTAKSRQDLQHGLKECQPRCVWFCCPGEHVSPRSHSRVAIPNATDQKLHQRSRHQSQEHRIQRDIATLATEMVFEATV